MLTRRTDASTGLVFYASPLLDALGVPHAFSTRVGGVSPAPFDSLNLGTVGGSDIQDHLDNIRENYRRLRAAIRCDQRDRCWVHQVHGPTVCTVTAGEPFESGVKADALVTNDGARLLSVKYADCVPILLATADGRAVAAVHAGWRGVVAGVVAAAAQRLSQLTGSNEFRAAIGPSIGPDAFEVGPEVLAEFDADLVRRGAGDKGYVDLQEAVRRQLIAAGLAPHHVDGTDRCTYRDADEFFSHRRDHGLTGRMAAIIGPRGS